MTVAAQVQWLKPADGSEAMAIAQIRWYRTRVFLSPMQPLLYHAATRVAVRLRAVEHAYRTATDPDAAPEVDRTQAPRSAAMAAERELELG